MTGKAVFSAAPEAPRPTPPDTSKADGPLLHIPNIRPTVSRRQANGRTTAATATISHILIQTRKGDIPSPATKGKTK